MIESELESDIAEIVQELTSLVEESKAKESELESEIAEMQAQLKRAEEAESSSTSR